MLICPDVATKYPRAHECCPQYRFFNSWNSHCNFLLLFPLYIALLLILRDEVELKSAYAHDLDSHSHWLYRYNWRSKFLVLHLYTFQQYCHIILCTYTLYRILCDTLYRIHYVNFFCMSSLTLYRSVRLKARVFTHPTEWK